MSLHDIHGPALLETAQLLMHFSQPVVSHEGDHRLYSVAKSLVEGLVSAIQEYEAALASEQYNKEMSDGQVTGGVGGDPESAGEESANPTAQAGGEDLPADRG